MNKQQQQRKSDVDRLDITAGSRSTIFVSSLYCVGVLEFQLVTTLLATGD